MEPSRPARFARCAPAKSSELVSDKLRSVAQALCELPAPNLGRRDAAERVARLATSQHYSIKIQRCSESEITVQQSNPVHTQNQPESMA